MSSLLVFTVNIANSLLVFIVNIVTNLLLCFMMQIRNSLSITRRLPIPVEAPIYVPEESESEESIVELEEEEEEESIDEFPGIISAYSV